MIKGGVRTLHQTLLVQRIRQLCHLIHPCRICFELPMYLSGWEVTTHKHSHAPKKKARAMTCWAAYSKARTMVALQIYSCHIQIHRQLYIACKKVMFQNKIFRLLMFWGSDFNCTFMLRCTYISEE